MLTIEMPTRSGGTVFFEVTFHFLDRMEGRCRQKLGADKVHHVHRLLYDARVVTRPFSLFHKSWGSFFLLFPQHGIIAAVDDVGRKKYVLKTAYFLEGSVWYQRLMRKQPKGWVWPSLVSVYDIDPATKPETRAVERHKRQVVRRVESKIEEGYRMWFEGGSRTARS